MEFLTLDDPITRVLFSTMFQQKNLVPIIGAGFSQGPKLICQSSRMEIKHAN